MKKIALLAAAVLMSASMASAASIVNSKHDLSGNYGSFGSQGSTEICVYCHTPHNPTLNVPLWNRNNPGNTGWSFYNSPTLTAAAKGAGFTVDSVSLFCMSCHDGVTTLGAIKNNPAPTQGVGVALKDAGPAAQYANLGGTGGKDLTNDHPVGFSYDTAYSQDLTSGTGGLNAKTAVNSSFGITGGGNAFFGSAGDQMECASCHKVHDKGTSGNFLRKENDKSALCLACHNK